MAVLVVVLAFFFALLLCLGLILLKWIVSQLGAAIFFMIMFLMAAVFLLALGDEVHGE